MDHASHDERPKSDESEKGGARLCLDNGNELAINVTIKRGEQKYNRLGWKRLTICMIVEAIALGSLSIPSAFAVLGLVPGVIITVGLGFIAIYTSYLIGLVKLKYPHVAHYADAVGLIWGRVGKELAGFMFAALLILSTGSHALTGSIAISTIADTDTCAVAWSVVSAVVLFFLALPPSFAEFAILGYIDFVSILLAIGITIVATGVSASDTAGGLVAVDWQLWPAHGTSFHSAFLSITNILFAYSFAMCQFSFMDEMHTPRDYTKSVWALGLIEIFIYTLTGSLVFVFVGTGVESPALLSASHLVSRIAFGVAIPVIFISGSINTTVVGRYIIQRVFPDSEIRYTNTRNGWIIWILLVLAITVVAWVIAEAIPVFNALLGLISSLFTSGFTLYFPPLFWFLLLKEGKWTSSWKNIGLSVLNMTIFLIGLLVLSSGTYASVQDIIHTAGQKSSFTC
ncbi:N amino acid transport system protein [Hortaea werneckii]|nr:N amino acid transport system protein [Hortaea werneckii]